MASSSGFIVPSDFSAEWQDITLAQSHTHTQVYTAMRYGRRFVLKSIAPDYANLTDYRLQQEQEFQLGIQLVHPNIAATYSLEEVNGIGRCIVQEWIDGVTLGEWLNTKPSRTARERVFGQLLDALEYIHGLQLVHHDIKADNILITRNGTNVKLIDFGLSALDATVSPVDNDPRKDIQALGKILSLLLPQQRRLARRCQNGRIANITAVRRIWTNRKRIIRLLPVFFSVVLLTAAGLLSYLAWHARDMEQQRYEDMTATVAYYMSEEQEQLTAIVNRHETFDLMKESDMHAYKACCTDYSLIRQRYWEIRDSLMTIYAEEDPLREQLWHMWSHQEADMDKAFYSQLEYKFTKEH